MPRWILVSMILGASIMTSWSQTSEPAIPFGRYEVKDFDLSPCSFDSTANAYYLFDHGAASIIPSAEGLKVEFTHHYAIKLLNDFSPDVIHRFISLYRSPSSSETLKDLRASVFNITEDIIYENRLDKTSIKYTTNGNYQDMELSFPQGHAGSIIEVQYTIQSDYLTNLHSWDFQRDLPVLASQYITTIPDYITYINHIWGDDSISLLLGAYKTLIEGYQYQVTSYSGSEIPAFIRFPFVLNQNNFKKRIEFELAPPMGEYGYIDYTESWPMANKYLFNHNYLGNQLLKTGTFRKLKKEFLSKNKIPKDTLREVYQFLQARVKWNGGYGIYVSGQLNKVVGLGEGNLADINLLLIGLLRQLGYRAYPVVLSTAQQAQLVQDFPTISKLNYLVAAVFNGGKITLMDASDPYGTSYSLPPACLHTAGILINEREGYWIELNAVKLSQTQITYNLKLDTNLNISGGYTERLYNYAAYNMRKELRDSSGLDYYFDYLQRSHPGVRFINRRLQGMADHENELVLSADIEIETAKDSSLHQVSFGPGLIDGLITNPLQAEKRNVPLQYSYPWMIMTEINLDLPPTYEVKSLPSSALVQTDDKSAKYTIVCEELNGQSLKINTLLSINKTEFGTEEYTGIKSLFDHVVKKNREKVVLLRK